MRESAPGFATGETVYLVKEVRAGDQIHEIGTGAHVLDDHGNVIVLHLDGSSAEIVTCPTDHVARRVRRLAHTPTPKAARALPRPSIA